MTRLEELAAELVELAAPEDTDAFSLEALAGEHHLQLEFMRACQAERRVLIMTARQVGKSWGVMGAILYRALSAPGTTSVFFGLNGVAARSNAWEAVWKPLLYRFNVAHKLNESRMLTTFPSGSRVLFTGTDDLTHVQNVLGHRFKGAILAIDEMQSQRPQAIKALLGHILPPTITPETTVVLSGTIPEVPGGIWWDEAKKDSWKQFGWGRMSNVHTPEARQVLDQHLADNHLTEDDPTIQRDWFGNRDAFDPNARTYFFRREHNLYVAIRHIECGELVVPSGEFVCAMPVEGIDTFAGSIDPGASDPCGVEMWGWDSTGRNPKVQQVFSWVSARNHRLSTGEMFKVAGWAHRVFSKVAPARPITWFIDSGGKQETTHLQHDFGLPVIKAADRGEFAGSLRRCNDLLRNSTIQVIDDPKNPLLQDYLNAQLDQEALARGQHRWSSVYHPTASENGRYLLNAYWASRPVPPAPKPALDPFDALLVKQLKEARRKPHPPMGRR